QIHAEDLAAYRAGRERGDAEARWAELVPPIRTWRPASASQHEAAGYHGPVTPRATTVETARLILRPFNADDFEDLYAYQSRPDVARYLTWEARDRAQVRRALEEQCAETTLDAEGQWLTFAVVWREASRVVGEVGLKWLSRKHRQGETGF